MSALLAFWDSLLSLSLVLWWNGGNWKPLIVGYKCSSLACFLCQFTWTGPQMLYEQLEWTLKTFNTAVLKRLILHSNALFLSRAIGCTCSSKWISNIRYNDHPTSLHMRFQELYRFGRSIFDCYLTATLKPATSAAVWFWICPRNCGQRFCVKCTLHCGSDQCDFRSDLFFSFSFSLSFPVIFLVLVSF